MNVNSMKKLTYRLREDYLSVFSKDMPETNPIKMVNVLKRCDGIATERLTYLPARTTKGYCGIKEIYVNDETGEYEETIRLRGNERSRGNEGKFEFVNRGITTFRCGAMTAVAIDLINQVYQKDIKTVGFIGNGRTNLMNARFIKAIFNPEGFVIRGSHRERDKNKDCFDAILPTIVDDTHDMFMLNKCDVVVVTTSNYEYEHMVTATELYKPKMIIVLDCGYTLDESFRGSCLSLTDYPAQMKHEYSDEFPFDRKEYAIGSLVDSNKIDRERRTCVYLHGIALADITTAEMIAKGEISL